VPFVNLDDVPEQALLAGTKVRFVHSDHMSFAHWRFEAGAELPEHSHPHEQVSNFVDGEFEITVAGETRRVGPGSVVIIPPYAAHSGRAITEVRVIDAFYPIREDYRSRDDG